MSNLKLSKINMEFIENSICQGIQIQRGIQEDFEGDCARVYFAGRTLCIDMYEYRTFYSSNTITINHTNEDFGFFSGGFRRLLSIKALRLMEELMVIKDVKHNSKWL